MSKQKIGKVKGGKSKKSFNIFWDPSTKRVWVEECSFWGSTLKDTGVVASSACVAMNAGEAYVYNR